jgi:4-diphosphocytidyl-2-C-methyl-D-erythritol kinase
MTGARTVAVAAPAKINLGLEILGRRDDGYHEIRTVMAAIGLYDSLSFTLVPGRTGTEIRGTREIPQRDNLIQKAIEAFGEETGTSCGFHVEVEKRIPSPGGLGGASSDAAVTLLALNAIHGAALSSERMTALAARLGSDVPFFLGSPVAIASGTGTELEPLPSLTGFVVLVVPKLSLPAKTARLYASLTPDDFTTGASIQRAADMIRGGRLPAPELLRNAFGRPLYDQQPPLRDLATLMRDAGAPHIALSGAGPAHYSLFASEEEARHFARALKDRVSTDTKVAAVPFLTHPTSVDLVGR